MGSQRALPSDEALRRERFTGLSLTPMSMFVETLFVYTGGSAHLPIFHTHWSLFICVFCLFFLRGGGEWGCKSK